MSREVEVQKTYRHYKGKLYTVLCVGYDSETLKEVVIYKSLQNGKVFVQDQDRFLDIINKEEYPDNKQEYRFERYTLDD